MTYTESIKYIISTYGKGSKRGFDVLLSVLAELGSPQKNLRCIHVAGTNGKGSACAMLSEILKRAGYKTGMFTSPHLSRFNERLQIDGKAVCDEKLASLCERVKATTETVLGKDGKLSYFELLTIMGFLYFYEEKVDLLVLEVGLGGRLDATNVIENPLVSLIMSIGLDHMEQLGGEIGLITVEKCGIIKKNCPTVLYFQPGEVYNVVKDVCGQKQSELYYPENFELSVENAEKDVTGEVFSLTYTLRGEETSFERVEIGLTGDCQPYNAAVVLLTVKAMRDAGIEIPEKAVAEGLLCAKWPGRVEVAGERPLVVLDGAHNLDGAQMLQKTIARRFGKKPTMLIGILKDKQYPQMLAELCKNAGRIVLTRPLYGARAVKPAELYNELVKLNLPGNIPVSVIEDCRKAFDAAKTVTPEDGTIIVCGSLYLVGDIRDHIRNI